MEVIKKGFNGVQKDNDSAYIDSIQRIVNNLDPNFGAEITKTPSSLSFRICLSDAKFFSNVLHKINEFNTSLGIQAQLGKSMKQTATIQFSI